ncbi:DUF4142 domain-containing protein [Rhodopirellula sallentina]|uniref:Putative secreted protein n=1 Tax=Rhodopirellula sallentina SM41 TaxID=1263870 RepID=M5UMD3_9BACT|nr:DUF4142 domain-containing protein [Rhodopirellula sallentina]EMI57163.1 putative secreted protein [Rhodopirellula sallentina SM41]
MMKTTRLLMATLVIATTTGITTAHAQQNSTEMPINPTRIETDQSRSNDPTTGSAIDQNDRYEARRVSPQSDRDGTSVKDAILKKLLKANQAEIELAQLATQRTQNQEVRQLAQTMIEDHRSLNESIQRASNDQPNHNASAPHQSQSNSRQHMNRGGASNQSTTVPEQLCKIAEQACDNSLQMTKDMLNRYEGQDFEMAFLGQQCVAHINMLAELKAVESSGPSELQSIAQKAIEKVENHLQKCKQLAKKLEDDREKSQS